MDSVCQPDRDAPRAQATNNLARSLRYDVVDRVGAERPKEVTLPRFLAFAHALLSFSDREC